MGNILGDKGMLTSWTAWGIFLYTLGPQIVQAAGASGFITPEGATAISGLFEQIGGVLGALGVRRALGRAAAPPVG